MTLTLKGAICTLTILLCHCYAVYSQDSLAMNGRFLKKADRQAEKQNKTLSIRSEKYLRKLSQKESRLKQKLAKTDSAGAEQLFGDVQQRYNAYTQQLQAAGKGRAAYLPYLDSLKGGLSFLQEQASQLSPEQLTQAKNALQNLNSLQDKFRQTEQLQAVLKQRQQQVQSYLAQHTNLPKSLAKELAGYKSQYYYYAQQLREYKEMWKHPDQLQQKALAALSRLPAFQNFMKEHSALAGLFRLPDNYGTPAALNGLQTRSEIQQLIQSQVGNNANTSQVLQQNMQAARGQLSKLKDKASELGSGNSDIDMPASFKPNGQKIKTFLQRLEYGSNLQTTRSNSFFPTTTDIGLSLGYKLNDKSMVGIGASYKIGWGENISHVAVSSEGMGLRSFLDYRIKGSFYISGGLEYNYQQPFNSLGVISHLDSWQQSGLIGISKIVSLKSKLFKKTKLQLLWDFLSYSQVPRSQPVKFRVGYSFN